MSLKVKKTYRHVVAQLENADSEFYYSPRRANHVIEFFENYCHHSKGKAGGQLVKLELWEKALQLQKMSQATNSQLIWIASISLLVGGIGVMNIMLVSVTERTSEIGLKKAIGAKKKRILLQFLTESAVLTSLGGIIGVISGVILAQVISKIMQIPVSISVPAIGVAVVFSTLIGVVFGMLPAIQAANLNPIEALRRE